MANNNSPYAQWVDNSVATEPAALFSYDPGDDIEGIVIVRNEEATQVVEEP